MTIDARRQGCSHIHFHSTLNDLAPAIFAYRAFPGGGIIYYEWGMVSVYSAGYGRQGFHQDGIS